VVRDRRCCKHVKTAGDKAEARRRRERAKVRRPGHAWGSGRVGIGSEQIRGGFQGGEGAETARPRKGRVPGGVRWDGGEEDRGKERIARVSE